MHDRSSQTDIVRPPSVHPHIREIRRIQENDDGGHTRCSGTEALASFIASSHQLPLSLKRDMQQSGPPVPLGPSGEPVDAAPPRGACVYAFVAGRVTKASEGLAPSSSYMLNVFSSGFLKI